MLGKKCIVGLMATAFLAPWAFTADQTSRSDWPQFRGPRRDGLSTDTGLLKQWPREGPKLLWTAKGAGRGYASVAISGGRLYTMGDDEKDEYVVCFAEKNGQLLWKTKIDAAWSYESPERQSSRCTPTLDGELLYTLSAHGKLVCLESATGQERWHKNLKELGGYKPKRDRWGYSESPLIDGDKVVCTPGGAKVTMLALNKRTGEPIWKAVVPNDRGAGHASIVVSEIGKTRVYVQTTGGGALGVRASDGKVLWTYPIEETVAVCPTPIVRGDLVFFTSGYKLGGALLRQAATPDGSIAIKEVYPINTNLKNKHGGVLLVGDFLYGASDDQAILWCAELMTGKVRWKERGTGKNSLCMTAADGLFYVRYGDGRMVLAKVTPESPGGYKEISFFKIPNSGSRPSWSYPVVTGGKLFLREEDHILCYDITNPKEPRTK